jgi:hypothetical protein
MTTNMPRLQYTTSNFVRSHGKAPSGRGSWGFQRSDTHVAFDRDLHGEVIFHNGTLSEAKAAHKASGAYGLWAVMP